MKEKQPETEFVERIRQELDRSVADLDSDVTTRLRRARLRALTQQRKNKVSWLTPQRMLPAFAVAAALLVLVVLHDFQMAPVSQLTSGIEDVEILASSDNPDFFHELDFYSWLAEEMDRPG